MSSSEEEAKLKRKREEIDDDQRPALSAAKYASLMSARSDVQLFNDQINRLQILRRKVTTPGPDFDVEKAIGMIEFTKAEIPSLRAQLSGARAKLDQLNAQLGVDDYTQVRRK